MQQKQKHVFSVLSQWPFLGLDRLYMGQSLSGWAKTVFGLVTIVFLLDYFGNGEKSMLGGSESRRAVLAFAFFAIPFFLMVIFDTIASMVNAFTWDPRVHKNFADNTYLWSSYGHAESFAFSAMNEVIVAFAATLIYLSA